MPDDLSVRRWSSADAALTKIAEAAVNQQAEAA
jgi:hypothetical protein